jgi:hypothetical protein
VAVVLSTTHYLELPNQYSNCSYNPDFLELICFFDQPITPNAVFTIDPATSLKLKVADRPPAPTATAPTRPWCP